LPTVSNASPLIWLSKAGKILLLKELFGEIIVPDQVYKEAVENGLAEGFSDALVIKECFDHGWIKTSRLTEDEMALCQKILDHTSDVHPGEEQAIILARRMNALLLMDESSGRAFAQTWGIEVRGVLYVIIKAVREKKLNGKEAKETVYTLISKGFRIEPSLLSTILRALDK
jgi:hypothetical protein